MRTKENGRKRLNTGLPDGMKEPLPYTTRFIYVRKQTGNRFGLYMFHAE